MVIKVTMITMAIFIFVIMMLMIITINMLMIIIINGDYREIFKGVAATSARI